jgi:2-keto-4-pentenoate hydratase/2-oxohepta-3-ene-1,7-dioic acid hydratase in catechol pathway
VGEEERGVAIASLGHKIGHGANARLVSVKVARFVTEGEDPRYGIVDDDEIVVLAADPLFAGFGTTGERVPLADARLLAPVIPRSKVVCVGLNYAEHRNDMANVDAPDNPLIFLKPNTAVVGPGDAIQIPPVEGRITHEGELVVVIGRIAKQVKAERWADYVFGYTIGNDVSARDQMFADGQWARAKGYDTFAPIGPWIETELDPSNLEIRTYVDGEPRRHGNTKDLLHPIPELIEYISNVWTLLPGDIIMTGTPSGLGGFVDGQVVDIDIEGIGRLTNPARDRDRR